MKKALVLATFGSTHLKTLEDSLSPLIKDLKKKFPDYDLKVGFTSKMVIDSLSKTGDTKESVDSILRSLKDLNYEKVIVFANFLIPGTEYNKLVNTVDKYKKSFKEIEVTQPYIKNNVKDIASFLINQINGFKNDKFYLFMGHGSEHPKNGLYEEINRELQGRSYGNIRIACLDGDYNFEALLQSEILNGFNEIELKPFLLISGDHVKNDMIENNDSWLNQLRRLGFKVDYSDKTLLKYDNFRSLVLA